MSIYDSGTVTNEQLIYSEKTVYTKFRFPEISPGICTPGARTLYATSTHHIGFIAVVGRLGMAVVVEAAVRSTARRYNHRTREFPALLSADHGFAAVISLIPAAVVVPKINAF